jgi:hypothetical protein
MNSRLIPASENWHPLDGVPAPEYIPPHWIGPHVGRRLIEASRTLSRLPAKPGPGNPRTAWPLYRQDVGEYFAALVDAENPAQHAAERNRAHLLPTAEDIMRMEIAISWPGRYLGAELSRVVQHVARYRALDWASDEIARKLCRSPSHLRRCNRMGLDKIASALHRDSVPVF